MSATMGRKISFSGTFKPDQFIKSLSKKSTPGRRKSSSQSRRSNTSKESIKKDDEKNEEKRPFPILKILFFPGRLLNQIDPLSISYSRDLNGSERAILGTPSLDYQFGFSMNPKVTYFENFAGQTHTEKSSSRFSIRTGIKITSRINTNLDYNINRSRNQSTEITGNSTSSTIFLKDRSLPFPSWSLQWRGLERLPLFSKLFKTASLSHSYSGTKTETWKKEIQNVIQEQISSDFRPLIGLNLSFKNGMSTNIQYGSSISLQKTQQGQGYSQSRNTKSSMSITANYSKRGGIKLPFMKNRLDNNIDFSFNFSFNKNQTDAKKSEEGKFVKTSSSSNWSLKPSLRYSFTSNVTGGTYLEIGERNDLRMGKTKITAFGINVNISLAGR